jgi:DnaJ-class molecular chaperone
MEEKSQVKIEIEKVTPEYYAQTCPNCQGRGTVGYERRPCPTCGQSGHPGVIFVPVRMDGGSYENR